MSAKGDFYALRAENLRAPAANILKQEFLAKGAEAAVHPHARAAIRRSGSSGHCSPQISLIISAPDARAALATAGL